MDEIRFNSLNELYTRLLPAFNTVKNVLLKEGIYVREIDLWNYFKESIWSQKSHLDLYIMVDEILHVDKNLLINYINKTK